MMILLQPDSLIHYSVTIALIAGKVEFVRVSFLDYSKEFLVALAELPLKKLATLLPFLDKWIPV